MISLKFAFIPFIILLNKAVAVELDKLNRLFNNETDGSVDKIEVCRTDDCQQIADELLRSLNKSADPCDDFYEYTCGGWSAEDNIPAYLPSWSRIQLFQTVVFQRIKGIIETEVDSNDILPIRQAKKWYHSCMDLESINKYGLRSLESILMHGGGWPMVMDPDEWDPVENTWQRVEQYFFQIRGSYVFYDLNPPGFGQNTDDVLLIKPANGPQVRHSEFSFRDFHNNKYEGYIDFVAQIAKMFIKHTQANISDETIRKDAEELVEFEKALNSISVHKMMTLQRNLPLDELVTYSVSNDKQMESENGEATVNFKKLVENVLGLIGKDYDGSMNVIVRNRVYLEELPSLLQKTPPRTIVNYIHWHFVCNMMIYVSEEIRNLIFRLEDQQLGIIERKPRWLECIQELKLSDAAAYAFTQKYFSDDSEKKVRSMTDEIRDSMEKMIDKTNLLDNENKEEMKAKLKKLKIFVGFPQWYKNRTHVINLFRGLNIGDYYLDNVLSYRKFSLKVGLMNMFSSENKYDGWDLDPITINARYQNNMINLPVANMQPPLFTLNVPQSVNYGISGVIIGHEISHGFDNNGLLYDQNHVERELSEATSEMVNNRKECFINQFNEFFRKTIGNISGDESPGAMTVSENIADASGLESTYSGYKNYMKKNTDTKLPGFEEFTDEQMFFISYGNVWCEALRPQYEKMFAQEATHSLGRIRLLGSISNTEGFARAFNCPKGSPMNPENKCDFWEGPGPKTVSKRKKREYPWAIKW
ncbi:membrane metallo-endopeptidase-like 1 [Microplitis mediator]|uniref:membrane metallo-endopeptidase-like 1 n=1 Tax=Microplitis mediator TaxID=375433 RepID=UPI00255499E7|nr:membrane metallo-endopeptidase-like 1 [Microplitis mediator]